MNAPCLQVILCLCMFINGVMLTFYVTVGYRGLEAFARSNWTIGTKPPRSKTAAESHRDVEDKDLPNKTSEVTIEFTPEAPPEVTTKALTKVTTTVAQSTTVGFSLRELSAIARNNWTIGSEAWRSNPAIELQRDVEGKDLPNNTSEVAVEFTPEAKTEITPKATTEVTPKATTKATTEVSKKATREGAKIVAKDATAPLTSGGVPVDGLTFDLIFGTETSLNLASDIWMQVTLSSWQSPGTKTKLGLFLGWNAVTTAVCYVMSLSLADFNSRLVPYKPGEIKGTEEEAQYRSTLKTSGIIKYTSLLVVKVCVLGCILKFFVDWERLAEESRLQEGQAYPFGIAAPWPIAYPAQPGAYPAPPGAYPAPPGGFPALGQCAYPTPYYANPPRGVGGAPPAGYPPPKAVLHK